MIPPSSETAPAERIRMAADQRYDQVRSDPNLSIVAKRALIGKAFLSAKQQMTRLQENQNGSIESARLVFMRAAFGAPSDPVAALSYRDACDRAAQIDDPGVAATAISRAIDTGDKLMAQALGQRAFDECGQAFGGGAWSDVLDQYGATSTTVGDAIGKLVQQRNTGFTLATAWQYLIVTPPELAAMSSDHQVQALIEQYDQAPSARDTVIPGYVS